ncbi:MAG: hypothetical protein ABIR28_02595 [Vicinamibacteria bacterium]
MIKSRSAVVLLVSGLALLVPGCSNRRAYPEHPRYEHPLSAYDQGYRSGLRDGQWAGYRDFGKPVRHDFSRDGRYRQGTEGYRPQFGSRSAYTDGYRSGYERGYRDRRAGERDRHRK